MSRTHQRDHIGRIFPFLCCLMVMSAHSLALPSQAVAHPMGNFSINHFSALEIGPKAIRVLYVIDMAEIPTFQEMQQHILVPMPSDFRTNQYLQQKAKELAGGLFLTANKQRLPLTIQSAKVTFPPGAGKLPTLRMQILFEALLPVSHGTLEYEDHNFSGRMGWKEIVARPSPGIRLADSSVSQFSPSQQLTTYQQDLLQTPPQDRTAIVSFEVASLQNSHTQVKLPLPSITEAPTSLEATNPTLPTALTELLATSDISISLGIVSMAVALGLGAFHALEPGHGKTLVAAYLVGSRGTPWHALLLGVIVTASHTIGVFALGGGTLFASQYFFPEQVYPWLGVTSGLLIMGTGILLLQRIIRTFGHQHDGHHQAHGANHQHAHDHGVGTSYRSLFVLGMTGGMIPCPAALVVLLSAVALNRIGFGLFLIVAFSAGLALVLTTIGLLLVVAKGRLQQLCTDGPWLRYIPYVSPAVILPLGLFIAIRSFIETGLLSSYLI